MLPSTCIGETNTNAIHCAAPSQDLGASLILQPQDSSMTKKTKSAFQEIPQVVSKPPSPNGDAPAFSILPGTINYQVPEPAFAVNAPASAAPRTTSKTGL